MRRRLGPQVLDLLRRGGATEYLVAVRVATEARYDIVCCLRLRDPELVHRLEAQRCVGRLLLGEHFQERLTQERIPVRRAPPLEQRL